MTATLTAHQRNLLGEKSSAPGAPSGDTWGGPMTLPTMLPAILEALRNAGATEEMIAAAVKADGEARTPHPRRGGRPRKHADDAARKRAWRRNRLGFVPRQDIAASTRILHLPSLPPTGHKKRKADRRSRLSKSRRQAEERREQARREAEEQRRADLAQAVVTVIGKIGIDGDRIVCAVSERVGSYELIDALEAKIDGAPR
jgi:hypothetical protein